MAISAQGTDVKVGTTTPDTDVGEVISFSGLDGEANELDATHLLSTAREKLLGLQDYGNFSMEINKDYSDAGQLMLIAAQASGDIHKFLITLPDATTLAFDAIVKNASALTGGVDAILNGSVSLAITGDVTIT